MPLAHLIFFEEPRELTDAEYEEARLAGHLRDPKDPPSAGVRHPVTEMTQQGIEVIDPPGLEVLDDADEDATGEAKPAAKTKPKSKTKES